MIMIMKGMMSEMMVTSEMTMLWGAVLLVLALVLALVLGTMSI